MSVEVFKEALGQTYVGWTQFADEELILRSSVPGKSVRFYHLQEYRESVYIEDIVGDLDDLLDSEILEAEEVIKYTDECTWTFYKFRTKKGFVTIRWCGESNGYCSEFVDVEFF